MFDVYLKKRKNMSKEAYRHLTPSPSNGPQTDCSYPEGRAEDMLQFRDDDLPVLLLEKEQQDAPQRIVQADTTSYSTMCKQSIVRVKYEPVSSQINLSIPISNSHHFRELPTNAGIQSQSKINV